MGSEAYGTERDVYVALLRGINVGGRNKLSMKRLAAIFVEAGCEDVETYIQSGNVVFRADARLAARIPGLITGEIEAQTGLHVPVVMRRVEELAGVIADNPFVEREADERALHVMFLSDEASRDDVASLDPDRSPPDEFVVAGREIYLHCPDGVGRTRLTTAYFDARLGTTSTSRNWRTVNKLLELAGGR